MIKPLKTHLGFVKSLFVETIRALNIYRVTSGPTLLTRLSQDCSSLKNRIEIYREVC